MNSLHFPERNLRSFSREDRCLPKEGEIVEKAAAWFVREGDSMPSGSLESSSRSRRYAG